MSEEVLAFEKIRKVSEIGEVYYQCQMCPCTFSTVEDLQSHKKAFSDLQYDHIRKWRYLHPSEKQYHPPPVAHVAKKTWSFNSVSVTGKLKEGVVYVQLAIGHKWEAFSGLAILPENIQDFCQFEWNEAQQHGWLRIPKSVWEERLKELEKFIPKASQPQTVF
jgi:hypothetical protein